MTPAEPSAVGEPSTLAPATAPVAGEDVIDFARLEAEVPRLRSAYESADPFPHVVLDDLLDPEVARRAIAEFPPLNTEEWNSFIHANERKFSNTRPETWGPALRSVLEVFQSPRFVAFLSALTGIDDLVTDDSLMGGGLHQTVTGGFLNIHTDFTVHARRRSWRRRINLLLYLNQDWAPEYGGDLEFWTADMKHCAKRTTPLGNRVVVFTTDDRSFHGHPEPLACPPGTARQSLALYYFTEEDRPVVRSTEYRARPGDGARSVVIYLDKQLLRAYDRSKRWLGITDHSAGKILRGFDRIRRPRR